MRHIQLYLIICKKLYSGRVMHSLSWQNATTTSEKPLPKTGTVSVTLRLHLSALELSPGCVVVGVILRPLIHSSRRNTILLDRLPLHIGPFPLRKRVPGIKDLPEK